MLSKPLSPNQSATMTASGALLMLSLMVMLLLPSVASAAGIDAVMRSVVALSGRDASGEQVFATAFMVEAPGRNAVWLVSSAHSFNSIAEDFARVNLRRCERGIYFPLPLQVQIRRQGRALYASHANLDLAAIKIELPGEADYCVLSRDFIADERQLGRASVGAGSQVIIAGFPYGEACNEAGFAFARSGVISSFPLRPTNLYPVFYVDFEVFAGYSGAPVILAGSGGGALLMGMVLEEVFLEELRPQKGRKQLRTRRGLGLAKVLSAPSIAEFIGGLR
ncbi:MAG: hypothetical protein GQF41_1199 [Candidatus Rifleibacterium amylolyticum]|nr:MAG: hypothetical protein GQF41_1199 [Candidatus Rifleibacterium amylolyticum]